MTAGFARLSVRRQAVPTRASPTTVVIARSVSQLSVEVTSEYTRKLARFSASGAPGA